MKHYNIIKLLFRYLYDHIRFILYFLVVALIFMLILFMYDISLEPLIYASVLSGSAGIVLLTIDYIKYINRYIILDNLRSEILYTIENLPKYDNLIEQTCFELIKIINQDSLEYKNLIEKNNLDTLDYYTTWVHQIKTPIFAMKLLLQMDNSSNTKELQNELFKIEQYVDMVLSYLRIDSTSTDFLIKSYNLSDIVKKSIKKYAKPLILKKISIKLDDISCNIVTDEKWISFVIEQIISNSLKYTNIGGSIHIYEDSNRLYIQDNGIGIYTDDLPRIFERGFTGHNGRLDKKSTGIGLYLCKKILNKLNHKIEIESQVDIGTIVIIDFNTYVNIKD